MADYSTYDRADLLKVIAKQEKELKIKKYGLVWDNERELEQAVLDCENNLPILKRIKNKEIRTNDCEDNILIEGDNYHALTVLNYTHKENIDVIYIDPPYNTGAKDWKYNNNYVTEEDGYRHSKWLNMMEKRLNLAKKLLTEKGVFVVSIDHHELFYLGLLCDKVFEENNRLGIVAVVHKPEGRNQEKFFGTSHEYLFFYARNKNKCKFRNIVLDKKIQLKYDEEDEKGFFRSKNFIRLTDGKYSLRENKPHFYYPIYVNEELTKFSIAKIDGYIEVFPITNKGVERTWKTTKETFIERAKAGEIVAIRNNENLVSLYEKLRENQVIKTHWIEKEYHAYHFGTKLLEQILGSKQFDFPKSIYLMLDILKITANKNDTILDFFAGSGTTGHAVLELNKNDGGNRKFILCTNNENNICTDVTYPRIHNVIKGYKFKGKDKSILFEKKLTWTDMNKKMEQILESVNVIIENNKESYDKIEKEFNDNTIKIIGIKNSDGKKDGLGGNLQYFKTALLKKTENRDQIKINLTKKCTEMLCVKENVFNLETEENDYKIFSSNKKNKLLCIYFNLIDDTFDDFLIEIKKQKGKKHIYMFSMDNNIDKNLFSGITNIKIEAIPQNILDVYKQLVKMNIPVKTNIILTELNKAKIKIFNDKNKDEGARILRIVLEKVLQKLCRDNSINILTAKAKEEKISKLNDNLFNKRIITKVEYDGNNVYLTIGNNAAHGNYDDYDLERVEQFYQHIQSLLNRYNI